MKSVIKKLLGPFAGAARTAYRGKISEQNFEKLSAAGVTHRLGDIDLGARKKSDTLFILGSGSSISRYGEGHWAEIAKHDSIGFNFWLVHDFVPTYFAFESPFSEPRALDMVELMKQRASDYAGVPFIMKGTSRKSEHFDHMAKLLSGLPSQVKDQIYPAQDQHIKAPTVGELRTALRKMVAEGVFAPHTKISTIPQARATVGYLVALAVKLGYKKIVLCGVDLNDTKYFYDVDRDYYLGKNRPVPEVVQTGKIHLTQDAKKGIPLSDALDAMDHEVLKPLGCELFVGAGTSALHPRFPVYDWPS